MLKYINCGICFQEVPNEIALYFNISGCKIRCPGCHSEYLWEDNGKPLLEDIIPIIDKYKNYISCVCFMGGTHDMTQLTSAINIVKENKLKVCIYTGENYEGNEEKFNKILENIDYIKFGPYIEELGGLDKETTNQRFYEVINGALFADKTYLFRKSWNKN